MADRSLTISPQIVSKRIRHLVRDFLGYVALICCAVILLAPLLWMISTSLKETGRELSYPPQWLPKPVVWQNYVEIWSYIPYGLYFRNSVIVTVGATAGSMLCSALVAFGFARLRFPGRDILFVLVLSTLMLPAVVTLVPNFILFRQLGWIDTFLPLIIPSWLGQGAYGQGAFYIFLMRQFYRTIPYEYDEAARVDGASALQIFWHVILPLSLPPLTVVGIFAFLANWNDFLYPLVFIQSPERTVLALGVRSMMSSSERGMPWNLIMAGSFLMVLPCLIALLIGQKYFIRGIATSGLAGR